MGKAERVGIEWDADDGRGKCDRWVVVVDGESAEEKDVQKDSILTETEPDDDDAADEDEEDEEDDADVVAEPVVVADDGDDCSMDGTARALWAARTAVVMALVVAIAAS